jgi:DNA-3-methyladenine glycosylase I
MRAVNAHPTEGALVVRYALLIPRLLHLLLSAPKDEFLLNRDSLSALGVPIARISVIDKHLISYATILLMIEDTAVPTGLFTDAQQVTRCVWCRATPEYQHYHDHEWGFPVRDDRRLFEKVCLEGFQAGLSWLTILKKREAFRRGFADFDMDQLARFGESETRLLLLDAGIVRHPGKIASTINNAQRAIELRKEFGSMAAYFWQFEPATDIHRRSSSHTLTQSRRFIRRRKVDVCNRPAPKLNVKSTMATIRSLAR